MQVRENLRPFWRARGALIRPKSSGQRRCPIVSRGNSESKVARSDSYVAVAFYSVHNSSPSFAWLRRVAGETSREPLSSRNCDARRFHGSIVSVRRIKSRGLASSAAVQSIAGRRRKVGPLLPKVDTHGDVYVPFHLRD